MINIKMADLRKLLENPASAEVEDLTENLSWISDYATQANDSPRLGMIYDLTGLSPQTNKEIALYEAYIDTGKPNELPPIDERILTDLLNDSKTQQIELSLKPKRVRLPEYTANPLMHESALDTWFRQFYQANKDETPIDLSNTAYDKKREIFREIVERVGEKPENLRRDSEDSNPRRR